MNHEEDFVLLETPRFRVVQIKEPRTDGTVGKRQVVRHPGAVTILPDLEDGRVCLIRNRRASVNKSLLELPAGTLEPGEDPVDCASRELAEETGYRSRSMKPIHEFFLSPGILDERMHLFHAQKLVPGSPEREPSEQIENVILSWEESIHLIQTGQIEDAKTIVGLLYFDRFRLGDR